MTRRIISINKTNTIYFIALLPAKPPLLADVAEGLEEDEDLHDPDCPY